ncbi:hypothetical protein ACFYV7_17450 [Nocardia suismassiliense]|uniref:Uncharacterized protein n=1 Tax=Nocardia suismassiliense TaxID=2077092 RepID=A0ABW6QVE6_9NOCA
MGSTLDRKNFSWVGNSYRVRLVVIAGGVLALLGTATPTASADLEVWHADEYPLASLPLPKDPVATVRKKLLGTAEFTNKSRRALCDDEKLRMKYAKALDQQITTDGVVLKPELRDLDDEDFKDQIVKVWVGRVTGFRTALQKYIKSGELD